MEKHLAISSVEIQKWGEVYDEEKAFYHGTIFPDLNKPFFVTELDKTLENNYMNRESSPLLKIQQISFMVDDLRLYMDTHPEDTQGLELLKSLIRNKKDLMRQFALENYPLTPECMADIYENNPESECYCWPKGKIPWEGGSK